MASETELQPVPERESDPAVTRCQQAWAAARRDARAKGLQEYKITDLGQRAFCAAMPQLTSLDNIRAFIACIAAGILSGAVSYTDSTRLLYAAQVASTVVPRPTLPRRGPGRPSKEEVLLRETESIPKTGN